MLRVDAPEFELDGSSGRPRPVGDAPPPLVRALDQIGANPDLWDRLLVVGGPKGIVATRPSGGSEFGGWVYDLWLLERLAGVMKLEPLRQRARRAGVEGALRPGAVGQGAALANWQRKRGQPRYQGRGGRGGGGGGGGGGAAGGGGERGRGGGGGGERGEEAVSVAGRAPHAKASTEGEASGKWGGRRPLNHPARGP